MFPRRIAERDPTWKDQALGMLVSSYWADGFQTHLRPCPACGTDGLVTGTVGPDYEVEQKTKHGEAMLYTSLTSVEFLPDRIECTI